MPISLFQGDCLKVLADIPENSVDSIVTDPPYGLSDHAPEDVLACLTAWIAGKPYLHGKKGFMQMEWDAWVPGPEVWRECLRVLKPGGHMLCFAGTRSMDLMSMAIRLAGFQLRDSIGHAHDGGEAPLLAWVTGQGMPKGLDISKAIDKAKGASRPVIGYDATRARPNRMYEGGAIGNLGGTGKISDRSDNGATLTGPATPEAKQWEGYSSALKPSWEPILIARKPLEGNLVENVLRHGVGGMNVDACRIPVDPLLDDPRLGGNGTWGTQNMAKTVYGDYEGITVGSHEKGRYPANVITDGSEVVNEVFAQFGEKTSGKPGTRRKPHQTHSMSGTLNLTGEQETGYADTGSAARFFHACLPSEDEAKSRIIYQAKAAKVDRAGSRHPSIKPINLIRYLARLVTPKGGTILDPFAGSGTLGQAALDEGFGAILIERCPEYADDIRNRLMLFLTDDVTVE